MYWSLITAAIASVLLYWQYWRWSHRAALELDAKMPGPPALPFIGNALMFVIQPGKILEKIDDLCETYGQYFKFWLGPELGVVVRNPTDIRALLTSNKVNQKGPLYNIMLPIIGPGILTGGSTWRSHRKIATPSYNKKAVEHFMSIFNVEAIELAKVLRRKKPNDKFDVFKDVVKFTTLSVNQTLMGLSKEDSQNLHRLEEVVVETRRIYDLIFTKMTKWWLQILPIYWLVGWQKKQTYYTKLIDEFTTDIVRKRKAALKVRIPEEERMGIVDRYILCGELSEQEIKWETFTLFTTSQEASAKIASGVLMFLAHLPEWQDKVYNEILEVLGPDADVTTEHLKQLHYLDMVYKETLRYLSIAALIQRTVDEDITINEGKYTLPAGTSLYINIHNLHRDPQYWEDPIKVKPERFLPENVNARDPNAFVPFSLGPMDCLGRVYATALIKTIVIWALRYNQLEPAISLDDIKLHVAVSVSIADGYNITVRPRNNVKINGFS